jgi:predicted DNA-binding transcriptional regulator AlpA
VSGGPAGLAMIRAVAERRATGGAISPGKEGNVPAPGTRSSNCGVPALWISDAEVAALLHVHRATIWRWCDQGLIPQPRRIGGRTLWSRADIELFTECCSMAEFRRLRAHRAER